MIRYRYAPELSPPAPFVKVALRCVSTGTRAAELPAQVDIAADRTVLPGRVVEALALVETGGRYSRALPARSSSCPSIWSKSRSMTFFP